MLEKQKQHKKEIDSLESKHREDLLKAVKQAGEQNTLYMVIVSAFTLLLAILLPKIINFGTGITTVSQSAE